MNQSTFLRKEKKYLITPDQQNRLMSLAGEGLVPAEYPDSLVVSLYLDSPDFSMIRRSIEAGNEGLAYKEKLRIRCYGTPDEDSPVFFEVKKKFLGTVSKRRIVTDLAAMDAYLQKGLLPQQSQIMSELDYTMRRNEAGNAHSLQQAGLQGYWQRCSQGHLRPEHQVPHR